jgi:hypothetical protein
MSLPSKIDPSFNPPPESQEQSFFVNLRPLGSLAGAKKIDFSSGKNTECCIDLSKTELLLKFKINGPDGKPYATAPTGKKLGLVNDILGSFFSGLGVSLNNQLVSQCSNQHYLDYLTCMLEYDREYWSTILSAAGVSQISISGIGDEKDFAYTTSSVAVAKSAVVTVKGRIHSPLFMQEKLLPPGVELSLSLVQNDPKVLLYTDIDPLPTIEIVDCQLSLRYVKLNPPLLNALMTSMATNPYLISFSRTEIRAFSLAKGLTSYSAHNIHFNKIPSRAIVLFVPSANYQGDITNSPYKFSNANLREHRFVYNGVNLPATKIDYDMSKKDGVGLYYHVCKQIGLFDKTPPPRYTYEMFANDSFLIAQDFDNDVSISEQTLPGKSGSLGLEVEFASALAANMTMLMISQFDDGLVTIDNDQVSVE